MDWGKQEFRQRTLCEARGCHNRSVPKEPRGAKVVSLLRGLSPMRMYAPAIQRHVGLLLFCNLCFSLIDKVNE